MATRSAIAVREGKGFIGLYHHWDGYPSGVGATLHRFAKELNGDIEALKDIIFIGNPGGFISILKGSATPTGLVDVKVYSNDEDGTITENTAAGSGCEFVYLIGEEGLEILSSVEEDGTKMIGMFGMGNPNAKWGILAVIPWSLSDVDWDKLDQSSYGDSDEDNA